MDNKVHFKEISVVFGVNCLVSLMLMFYHKDVGFAFLIGTIAHCLPNLIFVIFSWLNDVSQTVVKGIAVRYLVVMFFKYVIVICFFSLSIGFFELPLAPLLAGYMVSLVFQLFYSLIAKKSAI